MCICVSLSAYVTLFCLFSPKISIILLHPDKNVRKLTMNSATYKRPFKAIPHATASAEARINATSGAYNGTQMDGCSGGPMSTTSQMLNLGESLAGPQMESSISRRHPTPTMANRLTQSLRNLSSFLSSPTCWWPSFRSWATQCCSVGDLGPTTSMHLESISS